MVAGVLFIAAIAGWQGYKYLQLKQSQDASTVYFDALKKAADGKQDDALSALAAVNHPGFGQLAKLEQAALIAAKGDVDKAVATYDAFAADLGAEEIVARLGGWTGYASHRRPGPITFHNGLTRFQIFTAGYTCANL